VGLAVLLALFGCNGATVAEDGGRNDGFPKVTLPEQMCRVDGDTSKSKAVPTGPTCYLLAPDASIRTQGEMYVAAPDKIPSTLCLLLRERLIVSRGRWELPDGEQVLVNGKYYHEGFSLMRFDKDKEGTETFREFLVGHGYETPKVGYVLYSVTKNVSSKLRFKIIYGVDLATLPKDVANDSKLLKKYMRQRFADDISFS
jgi:hypothetical protein